MSILGCKTSCFWVMGRVREDQEQGTANAKVGAFHHRFVIDRGRTGCPGEGGSLPSDKVPPTTRRDRLDDCRTGHHLARNERQGPGGTPARRGRSREGSGGARSGVERGGRGLRKLGSHPRPRCSERVRTHPSLSLSLLSTFHGTAISMIAQIPDRDRACDAITGQALSREYGRPRARMVANLAVVGMQPARPKSKGLSGFVRDRTTRAVLPCGRGLRKGRGRSNRLACRTPSAQRCTTQDQL